MWNRIQTAANTTTTTLIQTPAELLPRHNKRHRTRPRRRFDLDSDSDDNHRSETPDLDPDKQFWQESFDGRLNDLAVASNVPYRYEIFRGKTVPSPSHTPLGSYDHL